MLLAFSSIGIVIFIIRTCHEFHLIFNGKSDLLEVMLRFVMMLAFVTTTSAISCELANQRCLFRVGCGVALQEYVRSCTQTVRHLNDLPHQCPEDCKNALIALTSTNEGQDLMTCECSERSCQEAKERVEVCRPHVTKAVKNNTVVTCDVAQIICVADATCSKALEYYHRYCQSMFSGKKCSFRCKNSIAILKKQEKSAKLNSCRCTGKEKYDCLRIRTNMAKLCFNQTVELSQIVDFTENNRIVPKLDDHNIDDDIDEFSDVDDDNRSTVKSSSRYPWIYLIFVTFFLALMYGLSSSVGRFTSIKSRGK